MTESNNYNDADQAVLSLCEEFWKWRLDESPELATFCGFHQYDDRWDDISEETYINKENKVKAFLSQAEALDTSSCSEDVALSYNLFVDALKNYLKGVPFKSYFLPLNILEGIHVEGILTITDMKADTEKDFEKLIARLEKLPLRIKQVIDVLKLGVEAGVVYYASSVQGVAVQLNQITNSDIEKHGLLRPLLADQLQIPSTTLNKFRTRAKDIVMSSVFPAFQELKEYLEKEYTPHLRPHVGISTLKKGIEWYQQCLNFHLSCSMTPQEVHELGMKEVARIGMKIVELARKEGLPENLPDLLETIIKKEENTFTTPDEVLEYVKELCYKKIRPKIAEYFKNLPQVQMKVESTPEYLANSPAGFYRNGSVDGTREGTYSINTNNLKGCMPFTLPALSLHEGEPGHHLQSVYSLAATHLPDFRRYIEDTKYYLAPHNFSFNSAYVEGWGLYCEALGEEMELYSNSYELLGRYNMEILRAARLVVDTGLHAFGWSQEKAVKYLNNYTMEDRKTIEVEVDRYITWPGQACAYKVGEIKIWELRRKAEKELGSNFNIKEFHHCVLSCGSVPLRVLEDIVDKFIKDNKPVDE